jgi:hypothetical protein
VPTLRAVKLRRKGIGIELSPSYFTDAGFYCEAAERQMATPTLFDLLGVTEAEPVEVAPQGRSILHDSSREVLPFLRFECEYVR